MLSWSPQHSSPPPPLHTKSHTEAPAQAAGVRMYDVFCDAPLPPSSPPPFGEGHAQAAGVLLMPCWLSLGLQCMLSCSCLSPLSPLSPLQVHDSPSLPCTSWPLQPQAIHPNTGKVRLEGSVCICRSMSDQITTSCVSVVPFFFKGLGFRDPKKSKNKFKTKNSICFSIFSCALLTTREHSHS